MHEPGHKQKLSMESNLQINMQIKLIHNFQKQLFRFLKKASTYKKGRTKIIRGPLSLSHSNPKWNKSGSFPFLGCKTKEKPPNLHTQFLPCISDSTLVYSNAQYSGCVCVCRRSKYYQKKDIY